MNWFNGTWDGNNHEISNLCLATSSTTSGVGFFYNIGNYGQCRNFCLTNPRIQAPAAYFAGCLVGICSGQIDHCEVVGGTVNGKNYVGGLAGENYGMITRCQVSANVYGQESVGGLVGAIGSSLSTVAECFSEGYVSGDFQVGGLIGLSGGYIRNCYSSSDVVGNEVVGGMLGGNYNTVENCYCTGHIRGNIEAGGFVGVNTSTIKNCFWNIETSSLSTSAAGTGKTTVEMQTLSIFTDAGWDFINGTNDTLEHTWFIRERQEYPKLMWEFNDDKDGLIPQGFVTINKTRVGRTSFEYELAVIVRNSNAFAMNDVQMKLMDWDAAVQSVSDDSITIDTISAGATVTSTDTFKIVVDRSSLINSSRLIWELTYYTAASGDQVQQAVMSMLLSDIDAGVSGDISGDGKVNFDDFAIMAQQWDNVPSNPSADIDPSQDGHVWIEDLMCLADNWMK